MRGKLPYIIFGVIFLGYILLEILGPQPQSWAPSYEKTADSPFGSYVLFESLPDLFPGNEIAAVEESPADVLKEFEKAPSNYIIVQEELKTNQQEARALLNYVARGNNVFVAASLFDGALGDSLNLEQREFLWFVGDEGEVARDDYLVFEESVDPDQKHFPLLNNVIYNRLPYGAGGEELSYNKGGSPVMTRIAHGEGYFYIHSLPLIFTNYFMVDPINHEYISQALSFLPNRPVIWDEFFKPNKARSQSPVKYLLEARALKWAWLILLGSVLLFLIFEGKRRQRIIPILAPPANTSVEFTRTVGRLYFAHGDHKDISEKKIKFLLEYIRNRWKLPTTEYSKTFISRVASKSGVAVEQVQELFAQAQDIHAAEEVSEESLHRLHQYIDDFYAKSK